MASTLYLIGSILFIPALDSVGLGELLFDIGSSLIIVSQAWKLLPGLYQQRHRIKEHIEEDKNGFYVDVLAGLGGMLYLTGTLILEES